MDVSKCEGHTTGNFVKNCIHLLEVNAYLLRKWYSLVNRRLRELGVGTKSSYRRGDEAVTVANNTPRLVGGGIDAWLRNDQRRGNDDLMDYTCPSRRDKCRPGIGAVAGDYVPKLQKLIT